MGATNADLGAVRPRRERGGAAGLLADRPHPAGDWKLQGSPDAAAWTDLSAPLPRRARHLLHHTLRRRDQHRRLPLLPLPGVAGSSNSGPYLLEVEFMVGRPSPASRASKVTGPVLVDSAPSARDVRGPARCGQRRRALTRSRRLRAPSPARTIAATALTHWRPGRTHRPARRSTFFSQSRHHRAPLHDHRDAVGLGQPPRPRRHRGRWRRFRSRA